MTERWMEQVEQKRTWQSDLFDRSSVLLQPLIDLICVQNSSCHRIMVSGLHEDDIGRNPAYRSDGNTRERSGMPMSAVVSRGDPYAAGKKSDPGGACDRKGER